MPLLVRDARAACVNRLDDEDLEWFERWSLGVTSDADGVVLSVVVDNAVHAASVRLSDDEARRLSSALIAESCARRRGRAIPMSVYA